MNSERYFARDLSFSNAHRTLFGTIKRDDPENHFFMTDIDGIWYRHLEDGSVRINAIVEFKKCHDSKIKSTQQKVYKTLAGSIPVFFITYENDALESGSLEIVNWYDLRFESSAWDSWTFIVKPLNQPAREILHKAVVMTRDDFVAFRHKF